LGDAIRAFVAATLLTVATMPIVATSSYCPTSDPETTNTPEDTRGTLMRRAMPVRLVRPFRPSLRRLCLDSSDSVFATHSDDSADCSDFAFAAKNIYVASDGVTVPRR
jgi:hypothetical protein